MFDVTLLNCRFIRLKQEAKTHKPTIYEGEIKNVGIMSKTEHGLNLENLFLSQNMV
jgi:hypothetical protein